MARIEIEWKKIDQPSTTQKINKNAKKVLAKKAMDDGRMKCKES